MPATSASNDPFDDLLTGQFVVQDIGAPFVIGCAVGYFTKKILRITLFIFGAAIVLAFVMEHFGLLNVSNESLETAANVITTDAQATGTFLVNRLSGFSTKGLSAGAGFLVGLKTG